MARTDYYDISKDFITTCYFVIEERGAGKKRRKRIIQDDSMEVQTHVKASDKE